VAALNANVATLERQYTEQNALRKKCVASSGVARAAQRPFFLRRSQRNETTQHNTTHYNTTQTRRLRRLSRYWNMIEDMKGKIRVYARCRPFAK